MNKHRLRESRLFLHTPRRVPTDEILPFSISLEKRLRGGVRDRPSVENDHGLRNEVLLRHLASTMSHAWRIPTSLLPPK